MAIKLKKGESRIEGKVGASTKKKLVQRAAKTGLSHADIVNESLKKYFK